MERLELWPLRAVWLLLPFTAGATLGAALSSTEPSFHTPVSIALWAIWGCTLVATLVPLPTTLTAVRIVMPASVVAVLWASFSLLADDVDLGAVDAAGLALTLVAGGLALTALVGDLFVDGASYGTERRFLLRVPGPLLFGPLELAWAATVAGAVTGPLLLADEQWLVGVIATLVGGAVCVFAVRALHGLHRRWIVFVPAGFVVHDLMAMQEPVLVPRNYVRALAPALADTTATDLTQRSRGLAVEADLLRPVTVAMAGRDAADLIELSSFLFAPARPGALLTAAP